MSDVPPLPKAATFLGHAEGAETFYPVVFVAGPRTRRDVELAPAGLPHQYMTRAEARRSLVFNKKTLTLKGVVMTAPLARLFVHGFDCRPTVGVQETGFALKVKRPEWTYPTDSGRADECFRLVEAFGAKVIIAEEADGTT